MSSSAGSVDRAAVSSALWARSVAINLLALFVCRLLLDGFELHGVWAYALAAVCIELPTLLWLLTFEFWQARAFSDSAVGRGRVSQLVWVVALFALTLVVPLALATSVPGLLVAEWISPLAINGFWTYVAASAITTGLTVAFRQSRPLRFVSRFLKAQVVEETSEGTSERITWDAWFLASWYTHRKGISWAWRGLRVAALIAGTVTVGLWFGVVLGLVAWAVPALILWPLLRREEQRSGSTPEPFRLDGSCDWGSRSPPSSLL